jgi:hypothetical protein
MSNLNWSKDDDRKRMRLQGVEGRTDASSKDVLRRQADRLLAGYTAPVTKVPAGIRVTGSQVSGNVARSVTGDVASEKFGAAGKSPKSKEYRAQADLFGVTGKNVPGSGHIGPCRPSRPRHLLRRSLRAEPRCR